MLLYDSTTFLFMLQVTLMSLLKLVLLEKSPQSVISDLLLHVFRLDSFLLTIIKRSLSQRRECLIKYSFECSVILSFTIWRELRTKRLAISCPDIVTFRLILLLIPSQDILLNLLYSPLSFFISINEEIFHLTRRVRILEILLNRIRSHKLLILLL